MKTKRILNAKNNLEPIAAQLSELPVTMEAMNVTPKVRRIIVENALNELNISVYTQVVQLHQDKLFLEECREEKIIDRLTWTMEEHFKKIEGWNKGIRALEAFLKTLPEPKLSILQRVKGLFSN